MITVLNDNGQVSLPTGTLPAASCRLVLYRLTRDSSVQSRRGLPPGRQRHLVAIPRGDPADQRENRRVCERYRDRRHAVRRVALLHRPRRRHDSTTCHPRKLEGTPSNKPVLLHLKTEKGYGYQPAMTASDKMHGVAKFDVATGKQFKGAPAPAGAPPKPSSLTSVFANELCRIAETDRDIIGITAAMPGGTGMDIFGRRFPRGRTMLGLRNNT